MLRSHACVGLSPLAPALRGEGLGVRVVRRTCHPSPPAPLPSEQGRGEKVPCATPHSRPLAPPSRGEGGRDMKPHPRPQGTSLSWANFAFPFRGVDGRIGRDPVGRPARWRKGLPCRTCSTSCT